MTGVKEKEKGTWTRTGRQGEHRVKMSEGRGPGDAPTSQGLPARPQKPGKRGAAVSPSQPLEKVSPGGPSLQSSGLQNYEAELLPFKPPRPWYWASLVAQRVKNPPAMGETRVRPPVGKIPRRRERLPTAGPWCWFWLLGRPTPGNGGGGGWQDQGLSGRMKGERTPEESPPRCKMRAPQACLQTTTVPRKAQRWKFCLKWPQVRPRSGEDSVLNAGVRAPSLGGEPGSCAHRGGQVGCPQASTEPSRPNMLSTPLSKEKPKGNFPRNVRPWSETFKHTEGNESEGWWNNEGPRESRGEHGYGNFRCKCDFRKKARETWDFQIWSGRSGEEPQKFYNWKV